jgi:hypothetical protein
VVVVGRLVEAFTRGADWNLRPSCAEEAGQPTGPGNEGDVVHDKAPAVLLEQ